tara:strand:- start:25555 stop:25752 length:198 start_codon:yes stop_codon:yes gene_type:complete
MNYDHSMMFFKIGVNLDALILATPTGEARNHLSAANIHIMAAQNLLTKPRQLPPIPPVDDTQEEN